MEIWKDVVGYESLYQVSNYGQVKSLDRQKWNGGSYYLHRGRTLKQSINNMGYPVVNLSVDGKRTVTLVHRIVAQAFIFNRESLPLVNHKDGNKLNNHVSNLEWSTYEENNRHAIIKGLNKVKKRLKATNRSTGEVLFFESAREADRQLGISYKYISDCINGRQKSAGGYRWERY